MHDSKPLAKMWISLRVKNQALIQRVKSLITYLPEVGKAQLEAQSAASATSTIAKVALRFNLCWNITEVALWNNVFKICCALIPLRFQIIFQLKAQFYALNLILFFFDCNIGLNVGLLKQIIYYFSVKIAKNSVVVLCCEISIAEVRFRLVSNFLGTWVQKINSWYKNSMLQLRNCVAL